MQVSSMMLAKVDDQLQTECNANLQISDKKQNLKNKCFFSLSEVDLFG